MKSPNSMPYLGNVQKVPAMSELEERAVARRWRDSGDVRRAISSFCRRHRWCFSWLASTNAPESH